MAVSTTSNRDISTGDGVTLVFPFTFASLRNEDILVYIAGVQITYGSGYSVTRNLSGVGGTITCSAPPANASQVLVYRQVELTQTTTLPVEDAFDEKEVTNTFDKTVMMCQQLRELISRSILLPISSTLTGLTLPTPQALRVLRWNTTADALENVDLVINGSGIAGPSTTAVGDLPLFNNTTGNLLKKLAGSTSGFFLKTQGVGTDPIWAAIPPQPTYSLKAYNIDSAATGRQLPTSGAISGTYWHYGDWTSTGPLTVAHGTKIYLRGNMTLAHSYTVSGGVAGGRASLMNNLQNPGRGPGGPTDVNGVNLSYNGGAGGGCGGNGGDGGSNATGYFQTGGKAYNVTDFFGGSSGSGNSSNNQAFTVGGTGGQAGGASYIEATGNITVTTGVFMLQGANGSNGNTTVYCGGCGGGSGGILIVRCGATLTLPASSVNIIGGNGGTAFGTSGGNAGGGGGGIADLAAVTLAVHVSAVVATGGNVGTGGATAQAATAGSAGVTISLATALPVSFF